MTANEKQVNTQTPEGALALLAHLCGDLKLSRSEHQMVLRAVEVLGEAIKPDGEAQAKE